MSGREHGHEPPPHHVLPAAPSQPHSPDELEVVPGFERENLQGWIPELANEADIRAVIEKAFDYRGDITVTEKTARKSPAISSTAASAKRSTTPSSA